jgi:hypothetical protein
MGFFSGVVDLTFSIRHLFRNVFPDPPGPSMKKQAGCSEWHASMILSKANL